MYLDSEETKKISNKANPEFKHSKQFSYEPVTNQAGVCICVIIYHNNGPILTLLSKLIQNIITILSILETCVHIAVVRLPENGHCRDQGDGQAAAAGVCGAPQPPGNDHQGNAQV